MFTQFFGNYLLNSGLVSPEKLSDALGRLSETKLRLGVLAINAGQFHQAPVRCAKPLCPTTFIINVELSINSFEKL